MSASNWTTCPRCQAKRDAAVAKAQDAVDAAYGKKPLIEFDALRAEAAALADATPDDTLREDYELGITDGVFGVTYRAACDSCGYSFAFEHNQDVASD